MTTTGEKATNGAAKATSAADGAGMPQRPSLGLARRVLQCTTAPGSAWVDHIAVVYYADNETTQINSVTVGPPPENTDHAAAIAAVAALSLNTKYVSLPTASPTGESMFRALQSEIQRNMERIFIKGGSDASMTNEAMFVYFPNTKKDMSIIHVTRRAPL
jgi:hypothetical protein